MSTADATPQPHGATTPPHAATQPHGAATDLIDVDFTAGDDRQMDLGRTLTDLAIVSAISIPIQMIATDLTVVQIIIGLALLYVICLGGVLLTKFVPLRLPSVAWISLVALLMTLPSLPWGPTILEQIQGINFLALAIPPLAYAGFALSKLEVDVFKRSGWRILVVAIFVFIGTYVGSALIADLTLALTGAR